MEPLRAPGIPTHHLEGGLRLRVSAGIGPASPGAGSGGPTARAGGPSL